MQTTHVFTRDEAWKLIQDSGVSVLDLLDEILHELFTEDLCREIIHTILSEGAFRALAKQEAELDEKANPGT